MVPAVIAFFRGGPHRPGLSEQIGQLYNLHHCDHCDEEVITLNDFGTDDLLGEALRQVYAGKGKGDMKPLFDASNGPISKAVTEGFGAVRWGEPNYGFLEQLRNSGSAFAARKTQHQVKELAKALYDENGNLKNWSAFRDDANKIVEKYNQTWLRTEYETAVRRARVASQWRDMQDNELYTNARWLPSRSANRREAHIPFYNRVFSQSDPVWAQGPGTLWGCKCGVEATDEPVTESNRSLPEVKPDPGIDNNPGESGEVFTNTHPYYKGLSKPEVVAAKKLQQAAETERNRAVKKELENELKPFYKKKVELPVDTGTIMVGFNRKGNRHIVDDVVFSRAKGVLNRAELLSIDRRLKNAVFVESAPLHKKRKDNILKFYYYKDAEKEVYYNVAEIIQDGMTHRFLYSITTSIQ